MYVKIMIIVSESPWNVGKAFLPILGFLGQFFDGGMGLRKHALKFSQTEGIEI